MGVCILIFYTNSQTFRSLAVIFCIEKRPRTNYLVRQPLLNAIFHTASVEHQTDSNQINYQEADSSMKEVLEENIEKEFREAQIKRNVVRNDR